MPGRLIKIGNFEIQLLKHSRNPTGKEALSFQWTYNRDVHAEMMTHRWSRNYSSSRAIPYDSPNPDAMTMKKWIGQDPYTPIYVGSNRPGMQAGAEIENLEEFRQEILARQREMQVWQDFIVEKYNPHKEIVNRYGEPWGWITGMGTMGRDQFMNFIALRCTRFANAGIQRIAINALRLYAESTPQQLKSDEWHMPYFDEYIPSGNVTNTEVRHALIWSTARCAWISYNNPTKNADWTAALKRHDDCVTLAHATPTEHQLRAKFGDGKLGLVPGYESYRMMIPNESTKDVDIKAILKLYEGREFIAPN